VKGLVTREGDSRDGVGEDRRASTPRVRDENIDILHRVIEIDAFSRVEFRKSRGFLQDVRALPAQDRGEGRRPHPASVSVERFRDLIERLSVASGARGEIWILSTRTGLSNSPFVLHAGRRYRAVIKKG
jgi:hypothetical protein